MVGTIKSNFAVSGAYLWLLHHYKFLKPLSQTKKLENWQNMTPFQIGEIVYLLFSLASKKTLIELINIPGLFESPGPIFQKVNGVDATYSCQAEVALQALGTMEKSRQGLSDIWSDLLIIFLNRVLEFGNINLLDVRSYSRFIGQKELNTVSSIKPQKAAKLALLATKMISVLKTIKTTEKSQADAIKSTITTLKKLASFLSNEKPTKSKSKSISTKKQAIRPKSKRSNR
jgi:hypothetical protein